MATAMATLILPLSFGIAPAAAQEDDKWAGTWFACEFASREAPPDDDCRMFDDEGFRFENGRLTYLRVIDSKEAGACKKQREGQCFRRDAPRVTISTQDRGKLDIGQDQIEVRNFFCTQRFSVEDTEHYRRIRPQGKRCFWAGERNFFIARYHGEVTVKKRP